MNEYGWKIEMSEGSYPNIIVEKWEETNTDPKEVLIISFEQIEDMFDQATNLFK